MSKKPYVLITSDEDGDIRIRRMTEKEVQEKIIDRGTPPWLNARDLAKEPDPMYWGSHCWLLIRGEIVVPKPKTTATGWDL